jgi:hypothetical protein
MAPKTSKPPSLSGAPTPDLATGMTPSPNAAGMPHRPEPAEFPTTTPPSPQYQGLGSSGEAHIGGDSAEMPQEIPHQRSPLSP